MFPLLWFWAPQFRFPLGGDVAQDIEPRLDAFFNAIPARAGNGRIEGQAFRVASYGHQLGAITEVLMELLQRQPELLPAESAPLKELRRIRDEIARVKRTEREHELLRTLDAVRAIRERGGALALQLDEALAARG